MHHFKAKGGTAVNFNSNLSGDAHVYLGPERAQSGHALIPCSDLIEIVDHWRLRESSVNWREKCKAAEARVEELESLIESAKAALVSDANLALGSNRAMLILAPRSPEQVAADEQLRKAIRGPG